MAHVSEKVRRHVRLLLDHSLDQWQRLPQVEAAIDQWDVIDQIVFIEEWPLEEQHLKMLEEYACAGALNPEQVRRFDELKQIVERHRPIIERLQQT